MFFASKKGRLDSDSNPAAVPRVDQQNEITQQRSSSTAEDSAEHGRLLAIKRVDLGNITCIRRCVHGEDWPARREVLHGQ
jgi:hypothetical protein